MQDRTGAPQPPDAPMTVDAVLGGRVPLQQPRDGYRFGIDAVLLAGFASTFAPTRAAEIGAGCGVVSLTLAASCTTLVDAIAIELQPALAEHLRANIVRNGVQDRVRALVGDVRVLRTTMKNDRDLVVMNPPYFPLSHGQRAPDPQRAAARHEENGTLEELLHAARCLLHRRGWVAVVYPARQGSRLLRALGDLGLRHLHVQPIHAFASAPATLLLVAARQNRTEHTVWMPPITLYDAPAVYTPPVRDWLQGDALSPFPPLAL